MSRRLPAATRIAAFVFLRRRIADRLAQAKNNELPNEPKRAFAAGAGTAVAYAAA